jgi:protocatechuate 3,4-dioxygenase beta subunit
MAKPQRNAMTFTRRELLERCAAFGAITLATSLPLSELAFAWDEAEKKRQPTPHCELGPFYKRLAPNTSIMRAPGDAGMPLQIFGIVYDTRGEIVPNAKVEIWQTDNDGHYDIEGYRYRAVLEPGAKGSYAIDSVMPGHYPTRVCQHVHYLITAPGHKPLITQMYFATDPVFEGDPAKNYQRDPLLTDRELIRPVMLKGDPKQIIAAVNFDLVMETL